MKLSNVCIRVLLAAAIIGGLGVMGVPERASADSTIPSSAYGWNCQDSLCAMAAAQRGKAQTPSDLTERVSPQGAIPLAAYGWNCQDSLCAMAAAQRGKALTPSDPGAEDLASAGTAIPVSAYGWNCQDSLCAMAAAQRGKTAAPSNLLGQGTRPSPEG